jgi:hypothetical protein
MPFFGFLSSPSLGGVAKPTPPPRVERFREEKCAKAPEALISKDAIKAAKELKELRKYM